MTPNSTDQPNVVTHSSVTYKRAVSDKGLSYPYVIRVNCIKRIRETTLLGQSPVGRRENAF